MKTKKEKRKSAQFAADIRWENYRTHLVDELRKLTTKDELDFFLHFSSKGLRQVLMELRKRKHDNKRKNA